MIHIDSPFTPRQYVVAMLLIVVGIAALWIDALAAILLIVGIGALALLVGRTGLQRNDSALDDDDEWPSMSPPVLLRNDPATYDLMYNHDSDSFGIDH
jgi:hypothetical protein